MVASRVASQKRRFKTVPPVHVFMCMVLWKLYIFTTTLPMRPYSTIRGNHPSMAKPTSATHGICPMLPCRPEEKPVVARALALSALAACAPGPGGDALVAEIYSPHLDTHQRLLTLQALAAAAQVIGLSRKPSWGLYDIL